MHLRAGNQGGSYLTIMSSGGLQFGILQIVASFGNVWADQAYWQVNHLSPLAAIPVIPCPSLSCFPA